MKKFLSFALSIVLVLGMVGCGGAASVGAWQEQYDLGIRYLSEGNYEEAIIAFTAAIKIDPKRAESYSGLAEAYTGAGDPASAKKALEDGLAATGNEELRAMLDEMLDSLPQDAGVVENVVSGTLELSGVTYHYDYYGEGARSDGNVGHLTFEGTVHGPAGICYVSPALIFPGRLPGPEEIQTLPDIVEEWKARGGLDLGRPKSLPAEFKFGFFVAPELPGHTLYQVVVGLDEQYNILGYSIIQAQIPG